MSKLFNNQIDDLISQENHIGENVYVMKGNKTVLPRNAHSVFTFEISESVGDVLSNILHPKEDRKDYWEVQHLEKGKLRMWDTEWPCCAKVEYSDKEMKITTVAHYTYHIKPNKGRKGCSVDFNGPLNGLMNQAILPKMTYVHHTLEGKFVDHNGKDLTEFMPIAEYCVLRDEKNKQPNEYGETGNSQDYYGDLVNMRFNNEIPSFSTYTRSSVMQRYKLEEGQKSYGKRVDVSAKKDEIINRMKEIHGQEKPKHGAVVADEAAKAYIAKKALERD